MSTTTLLALTAFAGRTPGLLTLTSFTSLTSLATTRKLQSTATVTHYTIYCEN